MTDPDTSMALAYILIGGGIIALILGWIYDWYTERKQKWLGDMSSKQIYKYLLWHYFKSWLRNFFYREEGNI